MTYEHNFRGERVLLYHPHDALSSTSMCPITERDLFLAWINGNGSVAWKKVYGGDGAGGKSTAPATGAMAVVLMLGIVGGFLLVTRKVHGKK